VQFPSFLHSSVNGPRFATYEKVSIGEWTSYGCAVEFLSTGVSKSQE
jgi:hypothetical protein